MLGVCFGAVLHLFRRETGYIAGTLIEQARARFAYNPGTVRTQIVGAGLRLAATAEDHNRDKCEYSPQPLSHAFHIRPIESLRQSDMLRQSAYWVDRRR